MTLEIVSYIMQAMTWVNGLALLSLQFTAYRRHHHQSFLLLSVSTVVALIALVLLAIPSYVPELRSWYLTIYIASAVCYFVYAALGLWGTASLFRSYRILREGA